MSLSITKKLLLTGTALVAVSFISAAASAATVTPAISTTYSVPQSGTNGTAGTTAANGTVGGAGTQAIITGANGITITNNSVITGGAGGAGGNSSGANINGANAGIPAGAIDIVTTGVTISNSATSTIMGGLGGNGGNATAGVANGGDGTYGGPGVNINVSGAQIINAGTIAGAAGGNGGTGFGGGVTGNRGEGGRGLSIGGASATITNTSTGIINGAAAGTGNGGAAPGAAIYTSAASTSVNNSGHINGGIDGNGITMAAGATNGTVTNNNGGVIAATGTGDGIVVAAGATGATISNAGIISAVNGTALNLNSVVTSFTNTGGTVTSAGTGTAATVVLGANQTAAGNFTLNGSITNTRVADNNGAAVYIGVNQNATNNIRNTGTIISDGTGTALGNAVVFNNNVTGTFENAGTVRGNVIATGGVQTFINSAGTLQGNVNLGDGNNVFILSGGTVTGSLTGGINDDTLTFNGGTQTGAIALGAGTNTIAYNQNYSTTGSIGAAAGSVGVTVAAGRTVNVNNAISQLSALSVGSGSTLNLNVSNVTPAATGALTNAGTINIASGVTLSVNNYTSGTGTFGLNFSQAGGALTSSSILAVTNGTANLSTTRLVLSVPTGAGVLGSAPITIVTSTTGATAPSAANITDNSLLYDFVVASTGNNLTATATRVADGLRGLAIAAGSRIGVGVATALDTMPNSSNAQIANAQANLTAAGSLSQIRDTLESLTPTVDGSAQAAARTVANQTSGLTNARLSSLRAARSGVSSGDTIAQDRVWLQPFYVNTDQDQRHGVAGYSIDTAGITLGGDTDKVLRKTITGVAFSYANSNAHSDNVNGTHGDIDSYQATLYADHDLGARAFVDGEIGFGLNNVDQTRYNVGATGLNANADYNSEQYFAAVNVGQTYTPLANHQGLELTPHAGIRYTDLHTNSYTETGAGGLNLAVDTDDGQSLEMGVASELAYNIATEKGRVTPAVHVGYTYDAIGDNIQTTSAFTGGSPTFGTDGAHPAQSIFNVGASLIFYSNSNLDVSANYDAQIKDNYVANAGYLKMVRKF